MVAVVDVDILSNMDTSTWTIEKKRDAQKAAKNALLKHGDRVFVNDINYRVNRTSRREYTRFNDTDRLYRKNKNAFADKMRASTIANDIISATTEWRASGGLKHDRTDDFVDFVSGNVLIESGKNQYTAKDVVGITTGGGYVFYDVVDINPTSFIKEGESFTTAANKNAESDIQKDSPDFRIFDPAPSVNGKFSIVNETNEELNKRIDKIDRELDEIEPQAMPGSEGYEVVSGQVLGLKIERQALHSELLSRRAAQEKRETRCRAKLEEENRQEISELSSQVRIYEKRAREAQAEYDKTGDVQWFVEKENARKEAQKIRRQRKALKKSIAAQAVQETQTFHPIATIRRTSSRILDAFGIPAESRAQMRMCVSEIESRTPKGMCELLLAICFQMV